MADLGERYSSRSPGRANPGNKVRFVYNGDYGSERVLIASGRATIHPDDGSPTVTVGPGDSMHFHWGFSCVWEILEPIIQNYGYFDPSGNELAENSIECDVCGAECFEESFLFEDEMDICPKCFAADAKGAEEYVGAQYQRQGKPATLPPPKARVTPKSGSKRPKETDFVPMPDDDEDDDDDDDDSGEEYTERKPSKPKPKKPKTAPPPLPTDPAALAAAAAAAQAAAAAAAVTTAAAGGACAGPTAGPAAGSGRAAGAGARANADACAGAHANAAGANADAGADPDADAWPGANADANAGHDSNADARGPAAGAHADASGPAAGAADRPGAPAVHGVGGRRQARA